MSSLFSYSFLFYFHHATKCLIAAMAHTCVWALRTTNGTQARGSPGEWSLRAALRPEGRLIGVCLVPWRPTPVGSIVSDKEPGVFFVVAWLTTLVDITSIAAAAATTAAIVVGGWWFIRRRQRYPRATLEHDVHSTTLPGDRWLVRATVRVANLGNVLIELKSANVRLQQLAPCPASVEEQLSNGELKRDDGELQWTLLDEINCSWRSGDREIEPQESEDFYFDFVVDSPVDAVLLYSYFKNIAKRQTGKLFARNREIGWSKTTHYILRSGRLMTEEPQTRSPLQAQREKEPFQRGPKAKPKTPLEERQRRPKPRPPKQEPRPKKSKG